MKLLYLVYEFETKKKTMTNLYYCLTKIINLL